MFLGLTSDPFRLILSNGYQLQRKGAILAPLLQMIEPQVWETIPPLS